MIVKNNPGIKIKKVAELRKKSESTAAKQLADLKKKQLIDYRGANKTGGYYVIPPSGKMIIDIPFFASAIALIITLAASLSLSLFNE